METQAIVITDPEPEPVESSGRILGRLEAETEQISEEVETISEEVETISEEVEQISEQIERTQEMAWDSRAEVERLRSEMEQGFAAIMARLEEGEDDLENSETELIELPEPEPEAEPVAEVKTSRIPGWIL